MSGRTLLFLLLLICSLILAAFFGLRDDTKPRQAAGPTLQAESTVRAKPAQGVAPPANAPAGPASSVADLSGVRRVEKEHETHPAGHPAVNSEQTALVNQFAQGANAQLAADPRLARLGFSVESVDCRENSCLAKLRFSEFATADAFFRMLEDGRLAKTLQGVAWPKCPPVRREIPRVPATVQPNAQAVLQFECQ